jgi:hypothetical protein
VACYVHSIIFALSFYMQQVYGDRGAKIKGELPYLNINYNIQTFYLFYKKGEKILLKSSYKWFCKTTKRERLLHLTISLILLFYKMLLNLISFSLRFDCRILKALRK